MIATALPQLHHLELRTSVVHEESCEINEVGIQTLVWPRLVVAKQPGLFEFKIPSYDIC